MIFFYQSNSYIYKTHFLSQHIVKTISSNHLIFFQLISNTEKLKFLDEVETVNDEAKRLKEKGVDIIIVLSHCGLDVDRTMAAKCPLIDVIVGGHSHTFLYSGLKAKSFILIKYKLNLYTIFLLRIDIYKLLNLSLDNIY